MAYDYLHRSRQAGLPFDKFDYTQNRNVQDLKSNLNDRLDRRDIMRSVYKAKREDDEYTKWWEKNKHKKINVKEVFDFSPEHRGHEKSFRKKMKKTEEQGAISPFGFRYAQNRTPIV